ncbi:MAG: aryl-sulfate sulfotransferase [Bryobacterales bacterium]|nr:aryl-sulfate sulfotransferase [Bryobacterales bacterium]
MTSFISGILFIFLVLPLPVRAAMHVDLTPSEYSPSPVGTVVSWDAAVSGAEDGMLWYRFRARRADGELRVVRDYGPGSTLVWSATDREGAYEIEASVRNLSTGESAVTTGSFEMSPLAKGEQPVLARTQHPLVFLYGAPACPVGARMRVVFRDPEGTAQSTPFQPCRRNETLNFVIAGMRPATEYTVRHVLQDGSRTAAGPELKAVTGNVDPVTTYTVVTPPPQPNQAGVLLQSPIAQFMVATDLTGRMVWYYLGEIETLTRSYAGGIFTGFTQHAQGEDSEQLVGEFDLLGITTRVTNAARINEQLAAMGKRPITGFHHEVARLPGGRILALANTEQMLSNVQEEASPVDVLGDMILVLDQDMQVEWVWDAFEHMDVNRAAVLRETCTPAGGGCPPFRQAAKANDWLHSNSVQLMPDGHLLLSIRHQDWLVKIDYRNGKGDGHVIWRLGQYGDFALDSADPNAWFSHQHDASVERGSPNRIMLFDNGNTRRAGDGGAHSRGQVWELDEFNRKATLVFNADLGYYSAALGTAQRLPSGNYHFDLGFVTPAQSESVEVDAYAQAVYRLQIGAAMYRTFRLRDIYTPLE